MGGRGKAAYSHGQQHQLQEHRMKHKINALICASAIAAFTIAGCKDREPDVPSPTVAADARMAPATPAPPPVSSALPGAPVDASGASGTAGSAGSGSETVTDKAPATPSGQTAGTGSGNVGNRGKPHNYDR
jgi:hypothetical protein